MQLCISSRLRFFVLLEQILEALARHDESLVQMCGRLSLGCDVIPEELQVHFKTMCSERVEHINRRITNYRKVRARVCC